MNNVINNAIGIDAVIESIKNTLYDSLIVDWKTVEIDAYGRVYRNVHRTEERPDSIIPEWYISNNEYRDVFYNDRFDCVFTFIDSEEHTTEDEVVFTSDVKVVFMLDLNKIYCDSNSREDMNAQNKVVEILRENAFNRFSITGITKGIKNVFRGFDTGNIKLIDTHPYHCFSVNIKLSYYLTEKCN